MKRGVTTLLSVAGCLVLGTGARAVTTENPYQPIIERNVFGLKPPPEPPNPDEAAKQPPPNIFLTGITTVFGNKRALLLSTPSAAPGAKPGEKPAQESYMLTEGQREGDVEMLQIDEVKGMVRIRLAGKEMNLDFENNGVKITAAPAPAPAPGAPGALPGFPVRPGAVPPPQARPLGNAVGTFNNSHTMPNRLVRSSSSGTSVQTGFRGFGSTPAPTISTPGGTLSFGGSQSSASPTPSQPDPREGLTPEQVHAITIANQIKMEQEGDPRASLFPPLPTGFGSTPSPSTP